jgi:hypothetical protein
MKTKDFGLSCLLAANKCAMQSQELDDRGQVWIQFEDTSDVQRLAQEFYNGTVVVNLADFLSMHKQLKTMIYSMKDDNDARNYSRKPIKEIC